MIRRFDRMTVTVEGLDGDLSGWAEVDGMRIHLPGGLPGDEAEVRIEAVSRHRPEAWASLRSLSDEGGRVSDRVPECEHAWPLGGRCGGCPGMHVDYELQLQAKAAALAEVLAPLARPDPVEVRPSPLTSGWRNRTNHVVQRKQKGPVRLGSRAPRSADFAAMDGCLAVRPPMARLASRVAGLLKPARGIRYVSLRVNQQGDALVELITRDLGAPWVPEVAESILRLPPVLGVAGSDNDSDGNAIRIAPAQVLCGEATLTERFGDIPAHVTSDAFLQLNPEVAEQIYSVVAGWAGAASPSKVVDLYCGVGPLGLTAAAATGAQLIGVEVHAGSQPLASRAAKDAQVPAEFVVAGLDDAVPAGILEDAQVITVNPPRRGLDAPVRSALADLSGDRVLAYMSCSTKTLVRDVQALTEAGWRLTDLSAWDMLPNTAHVELLARLER